MPNRTYFTKEEKSMPGHKPKKDWITILACTNLSDDCKVKPMVIYHSENPRIFKRNKVMKSKLPVMWQSNPEFFCNRQCFVEWLYEIFGPQVKEYLKEKQLPLKCLLVMDNATAHPQDLDDDLTDVFDFIGEILLPPNTTSLLQPTDQHVIREILLPPNTTSLLQLTDQHVISNFKERYTRALFRNCSVVTNDIQLKLKEFWKDHFTILNCLTLIDSSDILNSKFCMEKSLARLCSRAKFWGVSAWCQFSHWWSCVLRKKYGTQSEKLRCFWTSEKPHNSIEYRRDATPARRATQTFGWWSVVRWRWGKEGCSEFLNEGDVCDVGGRAVIWRKIRSGHHVSK